MGNPDKFLDGQGVTPASSYDPGAYGREQAVGYDERVRHELDPGLAVERIVTLAEGGPVLELGIGTGRLALPLARRGLRVHGVDASPEMVAQLRSKPGGEDIPVHIGDFADVDARIEDGFALVVLAVNTVYALPDQEAQVRCFANAARHLRPGGRFVVEGWLPDLASFHRGQTMRFRQRQGQAVTIEVVEVEPVAQRMSVTSVRLEDGSVRVTPLEHRYAWPAELDLMAKLAGLELESRHADWSGAPVTGDSGGTVSVWRRAG